MEKVELSSDFLTKDPASVCRTCLVTPDTIFKIPDISIDEVTLTDLLLNCVSIKVDEDDAMQCMCEVCIVKLCEARQFKDTCLNSNTLLQQIMRYNLGVIKEENVELDPDLVAVTGGSPETCPECPSPTNVSVCLKRLLVRTGKVAELCARCGCHYKVKYYGNLSGVTPKTIDDTEHNPNIVTKSSFDEICRTCLTNTESMRPIFDISFKNIPIRDLIDDCVSVRVEQTDSLPQQICEPCISRLCGYYAFKQLCFESDCVLRQLDKFEDEVDVQDVLEIKMKRSRRRTCNTCGKSVAWESYGRHLQVHEDDSKRLKCRYCPARFNMLCNLKRHVMTHTGERPHMCDFCGKRFIQRNTLIEHKRIHTGEKPYACATCGKRWSQYSSYKTHIDRPTCAGVIKRGINKFECRICCGIFTSQKDLFEHNCEDTSLDCRICGRGFVTRFALKAHVATHNAPKHYTCSYCDEVFDVRMHFTRHMKKHRSTEHICNDCGKGFANSSGLWAHRKTHSGQQPYSCMLCNRAFSQAGSLKSHFLIHTGERPYSCSVCNKTFTQPNHLKYHMRTHSGEKPYGCKYCGKAFSLNGTLTVHMRKHTGETPYVCNVCGRGFYDSSSLKKHRLKHLEIVIPSTQMLEQ